VDAGPTDTPIDDGDVMDDNNNSDVGNDDSSDDSSSPAYGFENTTEFGESKNIANNTQFEDDDRIENTEFGKNIANTELGPAAIPRKLHFVWLSTDHWDVPSAGAQSPTPPDVADRIKRWQAMQGPDWEVVKWDNRRIKQNFPELLETLRTLKQSAWV
jgi:hypothetical protein